MTNLFSRCSFSRELLEKVAEFEKTDFKTTNKVCTPPSHTCPHTHAHRHTQTHALTHVHKNKKKRKQTSHKKRQIQSSNKTQDITL